MPIPQPNKDEKQGKFITRCISALADADPDLPNVQRVARCYSTWRRAKGIKASEEGMPEGLRFAFFDEHKDFGTVEEGGVIYFRKPILAFGIWKHPEDRDIEFEITPEVVKQIAYNFENGVPVEAPITLTHTDNPKMKIGNVKKFIPTDVGLDAVFSVADKDMVANIENKEKAPGVSCWLDLSYRDKQSNKEVGAVVKHVALVNHPYIEGLGDYKVVSLSEDKEADKYVPLIMSESKFKYGVNKMTLAELVKELKEKHKLDVSQLQEDLKVLNKQIEDGDLIKKVDAPALSEELLTEIKEKLELDEKITKSDEIVKALFDKVKEVLKLSDTNTKKDDEAAKVAAAAVKEAEAKDKRIEVLEAKLTEMDANKKIDALITENKVLPAEKESLVKLYKKDEALFTEFVATRSKPLLELAEIGAKADEVPQEEKDKEKAEIDRLAKLADAKGYAKTEVQT